MMVVVVEPIAVDNVGVRPEGIPSQIVSVVHVQSLSFAQIVFRKVGNYRRQLLLLIDLGEMLFGNVVFQG